MIATADSVTQLGEVAGRVLVAGSHGGLVAAHYAAKARVRAVILNDAGVGLEEAGVAGLRLLDSIGLAAAAVDHASARIGDGADMLARGRISRANRMAAALGVTAGMPCRDAAVRLSNATLPAGSLPEYREGRFILAEGVHGLDSIGMLRAEEDAGRVLVIGSHCALHGGRPATALPVDAALAFFNDAGGAISRLAVLEGRGIPAAAVSCTSARIGDARSMWASGIISFANDRAVARGVAPGKSLALAIGGFCAAREQR